MMEKVREWLESTGATLEGHFLLTSGKHSKLYLEKFRLLERPDVVEKIGQEMHRLFSHSLVESVVGAAVGGILLSSAVARAFGVRGIFAEREEGKLTFKRGFNLKRQEKVLIVEDVITTGGSVKELLELVRKYSADPVGVVSLVDRSPQGVNFGVSTKTLLHFPVEAWEPASCPLCRKGEPLESRGRTGRSPA